jgi:hypothetical protein
VFGWLVIWLLGVCFFDGLRTVHTVEARTVLIRPVFGRNPPGFRTDLDYQCSFGKLVVGREKRRPLVICDQCNWCYNHDVIMGFNTIIRTRTLEFTLEYDFSICKKQRR